MSTVCLYVFFFQLSQWVIFKQEIILLSQFYRRCDYIVFGGVTLKVPLQFHSELFHDFQQQYFSS